MAKADVFYSHAWKYLFLDVVDATPIKIWEFGLTYFQFLSIRSKSDHLSGATVPFWTQLEKLGKC